MRVVHWMKSDLGLNPFQGVYYETSSNTGGMGLTGRVQGLWAVPEGRLNGMWCCNATPRLSPSCAARPARDIRIIAEIPDDRIEMYVRGRPRFFPHEQERFKEWCESLCRDDDNGLVVDQIHPHEIISISLGHYNPENQLVLEDLDEEFFV